MTSGVVARAAEPVHFSTPPFQASYNNSSSPPHHPPNTEMEDHGPPQAPLPIPVLAIKQAICFSCWNPSPSLSKCGKCKRVSYCSQDCQKEHWKNHKRACRSILVASNERKPPTLPIGRTYADFRAEKVCGCWTSRNA